MAGRNGSLISPKMVRDFMMPNYRKIRDFASANDIPIISVDTDGKVDELVPIMMENGVNFIYPFEVQAGCDVEDYRSKYPRLGIFGGLDKRALARDKEAIDQELARAARMLPLGGYLPGPDHLVPPDVSWKNYAYFMRGVRDLIGKWA
jgi:uroporphyrinogen decarboxylase